jgi:hypothetical protein
MLHDLAHVESPQARMSGQEWLIVYGLFRKASCCTVNKIYLFGARHSVDPAENAMGLYQEGAR